MADLHEPVLPSYTCFKSLAYAPALAADRPLRPKGGAGADFHTEHDPSQRNVSATCKLSRRANERPGSAPGLR